MSPILTTGAGLFPAIVGGSDAAETTAFLARTSGLDATHVNAYKALINGLVSDSVFSKFDALYILATQDSTTAALNLVSSSFGLTLGAGTPAFTADSGYKDGAGGGWLDTGFNASTATTPKFTQNSAHTSLWSLTNATSASAFIGTTSNHLFPRYTDNNFYARINNTGAAGAAVADSTGHFLGNRSAAGAWQSYKNASSVTSGTDASVVVDNATIALLRLNGGSSNTVNTMAAASFGSTLSSGDVTAFYNRLRTYMTAVGVP